MAESKTIRYRPSPTLADFHRSNAFVRGVMGPIGSGKSVGMCWEIYTRALEQAPGDDGVRRSRWAVVRNTYPELKTTTLKTWLDWFGVYGPPVMGAPIVHRIKEKGLDLEVLFLSMDRPDSIKKVLSLELTGAWVNEARELPKEVIDAIQSRVGRFPAAKDGGATWAGVVMDTNPPNDRHWWYEMAEVQKPDGWSFWRQPPALLPSGAGQYRVNPDAENVSHHAKGGQYWLDLVPGKASNWVKVYLLGEYGSVMAGKPVYGEQWAEPLHVSPVHLMPIKGRGIMLGWDYGLTPSCVIAQTTPRGQLRILEEVLGEGCGVKQLAEDVVLPLLRTRYAGNPVEWSVGDPAGNQRAQTDEKTVFEILTAAGIPTRAAPTQSPLKRLEAVRGFLTRLVDRGQAAMIIDPRCRTLVGGFSGGYRYRRLAVASDEARYTESPEKNSYSHIHDALQYLCAEMDLLRNTHAVRPFVAPPAIDSAIGF